MNNIQNTGSNAPIQLLMDKLKNKKIESNPIKKQITAININNCLAKKFCACPYFQKVMFKYQSL